MARIKTRSKSTFPRLIVVKGEVRTGVHMHAAYACEDIECGVCVRPLRGCFVASRVWPRNRYDVSRYQYEWKDKGVRGYICVPLAPDGQPVVPLGPEADDNVDADSPSAWPFFNEVTKNRSEGEVSAYDFRTKAVRRVTTKDGANVRLVGGYFVATRNIRRSEEIVIYYGSGFDRREFLFRAKKSNPGCPTAVSVSRGIGYLAVKGGNGYDQAARKSTPRWSRRLYLKTCKTSAAFFLPNLRDTDYTCACIRTILWSAIPDAPAAYDQTKTLEEVRHNGCRAFL